MLYIGVAVNKINLVFSAYLAISSKKEALFYLEPKPLSRIT